MFEFPTRMNFYKTQICCAVWIVVCVIEGLFSVPEHACYTFTELDLRRLRTRVSEKTVCEGYKAIYLDSPSEDFYNCTTCLCCAIKDCYEKNPGSYSGVWSKTASGRQCMRWDESQIAEYNLSELYTEQMYSFHDYCRDVHGKGYTWCFTTDPEVEWETCDIRQCGNFTDSSTTTSLTPTTTGIIYDYDHACYTYTLDDLNLLANGLSAKEVCLRSGSEFLERPSATYPACTNCSCCKMKGCYHRNPSTYNGTWSKDLNGNECARWGSAFDEKENYCRDGFKEFYLFCFSDPENTVLYACDIPECPTTEEPSTRARNTSESEATVSAGNIAETTTESSASASANILVIFVCLLALHTTFCVTEKLF